MKKFERFTREQHINFAFFIHETRDKIFDFVDISYQKAGVNSKSSRKFERILKNLEALKFILDNIYNKNIEENSEIEAGNIYFSKTAAQQIKLLLESEKN